MTKVALVSPPAWSDLANGLAERGLSVSHIYPAGESTFYQNYMPAVTLDIKKALISTGASDQVMALLDALSTHMGYCTALGDELEKQMPDALITTCTYDVIGRMTVLAGKTLGIPVIHVAHGCSSVDPADAWYCAEAPGDYVLAPGERERTWWDRCVPNTNVLVTGHYRWDQYAALTRREPTDEKTICWITESGANPYMTPRIWQFKDAPQRAWHAFLRALQTPELRTTRVIMKVRVGEPESTVTRWMRDVDDAGIDPARIGWTQDPLAKIIHLIDVAVCQSSNAGVEASLAGIPIVNLDRPGADLLQEFPNVSILSDDLEYAMADKITHSLYGSEWDVATCKRTASRYGHNLDLGGRDRVLDAIVSIASGNGVPNMEARQLVTA